MVLQDTGLPIAQRGRDADPLLAIEHDPTETVVHGVRLVEAQRVLRYHVEMSAEHRERLAVDGVRVARGVDVRAGFVDYGQGRQG